MSPIFPCDCSLVLKSHLVSGVDVTQRAFLGAREPRRTDFSAFDGLHFLQGCGCKRVLGPERGVLYVKGAHVPSPLASHDPLDGTFLLTPRELTLAKQNSSAGSGSLGGGGLDPRFSCIFLPLGACAPEGTRGVAGWVPPVATWGRSYTGPAGPAQPAPTAQEPLALSPPPYVLQELHPLWSPH